MNVNANTFAGQSALDALQGSHAKQLETSLKAVDANGAADAKAAKEFESLFASMLVKEMRSTIEGGFFGDGPGADTYGQWFDTELGRAIAADGGLGLADVLRVQLGIEQKAAAAAADTELAPEPIELAPAPTGLATPSKQEAGLGLPEGLLQLQIPEHNPNLVIDQEA